MTQTLGDLPADPQADPDLQPPTAARGRGPRQAVLFDIDGTLIVTDGAGARSWELAFADLWDVRADISRYSDTGMTDPEVGRRTFEAVMGRGPSPSEFARLLERRMHFLAMTVAGSSGYHVLPGVEELLPGLVAQGYILGLVTGNLEAAAHVKLARSGLNRYFSFGGYGSDSADRAEVTRTAMRRCSVVFGKPVPPEQFLAVGDTPNDVEAAHVAGIECVAVASHKYNIEQLQRSGADWVVPDLREGLPPLAEQA
ncbi:MAG: HAD family hydrolase [Actinomycetota bacterium]|jgi:phosphoglycolate phosphatase-like HAD superfamily hydrolase|nr:HAD family hydrolase [Actinomycetota bacterium]